MKLISRIPKARCGFDEVSLLDDSAIHANDSTFFWAGATFAPKLKVKTAKGEQNIQAFLQDHFFAAVGKLVEAVGHLDSVLGIEVSNRECLQKCLD
jgi:hypothetical protein